MTAAAVWNRLQKSSDWLRSLCVALFRERGWELAGTGGFQIRAFAATPVKEPGRGSLWRIHSSVRLPSLACDFFRLTATKGAGTGESFRRFPLQPGDSLLADRGYSTAAGLRHVAQAGAFATVRVNTQSLPLGTSAGAPFDLLAAVRLLRRAGQSGCWSVAALDRDGARVVGRICALRKTAEAIRLAHKALRRKASKKGLRLEPHTLEFARYVILFTMFPADAFPAAAILEWDRTRWQVELVFQRFKSLAQLGHLPQHTDASAKAWLYGKLLVALQVEKLLAHARSLSPWGCRLAAATPA